MFLLCIPDMSSFSFFSAEHCMGEPHRGRLELYLWGYQFWPVRTHNNLLLIVRVGNTGQVHPPPPPPAEAQMPIGCYTVFLCRPPKGRRRGAPR